LTVKTAASSGYLGEVTWAVAVNEEQTRNIARNERGVIRYGRSRD